MEKRNKTYALLTLATVFWGIQPLFIKLIVVQWSPAALVCLRYVLISTILFGLLYIKREPLRLPPPTLLLALAAMGATGIAVNNVAQFTGLQYSTVTNCTLIAATAPAITALMAGIFIRERLGALQWLGIAISFTGVVFLVSKGSWDALMNFSFNRGDLLFFLCQFVWAAYSLISLRVMRSLSAIAVTAWSGVFGAIFVAGYGCLTDALHYTALTPSALAAFAFVVLCGGVAAMVFWNIGVKNAGPSLAAIFSNVTPVVGMLCGALFLAEPIGAQQLLGAAAIFSGVYLTTHSEQAAHLLKNLAQWSLGEKIVKKNVSNHE